MGSDLIEAASRAAEAAFCQRRKTLRNSLAAGLAVPTADALRILAEAGVDPMLRAENLSPEAYLTLGRALLASVPAGL